MVRIFTDKEYVPADLLQAGIDHLSAAELLFKSDARFFDSAGYLAHIGIELLLKSWILHIHHKFEGIHPLGELIDQLRSLDKTLVFTERQNQIITYLSNFEELRYPGRHNLIEIGDEDFEQVMEIADTLWDKMPDSLIDAYEKLPTGKKSGRVLMERPKHISRDLKLETGIDV